MNNPNNPFVKITKDQKVIYLFGANHTYDPSHPQFEVIKSLWQEFETETKTHPRVSVVEHWPNGFYLINEDHSIKSGGEVGFLTSLSFNSGVGIMCPEPELKQKLNYLEDLFPKEIIAHFFFSQPPTQWFRLPEGKIPLSEYLKMYIKTQQATAGWTDFDYSFENLEKIHQKLTGRTVDDTTYDQWIELINPTLGTNKTNQVSMELSKFRNETIFQNIKRYFDAGNSLFIVYGSGHFETLKNKIETNL